MITDAILPYVKSFTPVSDRLYILKLEGRFWDIVIINCYAPTEQGNNDIKCEFYEELERIYKKNQQKSKHTKLIWLTYLIEKVHRMTLKKHG